jgi:dihydroneopterin aldolase
MTLMLASVTGPDEAEVAIAGGADIVDLKEPAAGARGALPAQRVAATVAAIAGRRRSSAVTGDLPMQAETVVAAAAAVAATGVDFVKVGLSPGAGREQVIRAIAPLAAETRIVGVLFADREQDAAAVVALCAEAGFAGVMLDTAGKSSGRLLVHAKIPALADFVRAAKARGLLVGLAGGLEEPDVPRLLALEPDFLGFRGALCAAGDRKAGIDLERVRAIRRLIPREVVAEESGKVDYRLLSARGYHPATAEGDAFSERIFVRDYVLPVRIGAYSHEREAPQKVRFDVSVDVSRSHGAPPGMGQVLSYDLITDGIAAIVAEGHVDFVETLAERIGKHILRDARARRVVVKVEKLELGPGGVGVELTMSQPDAAADANPLLAMLDEPRKPRV